MLRLSNSQVHFFIWKHSTTAFDIQWEFVIVPWKFPWYRLAENANELQSIDSWILSLFVSVSLVHSLSTIQIIRCSIQYELFVLTSTLFKSFGVKLNAIIVTMWIIKKAPLQSDSVRLGRFVHRMHHSYAVEMQSAKEKRHDWSLFKSMKWRGKR